MSPEQWHGVRVCVGIIGVGGFALVVGAALLLQTNRAITRLQQERDAYRAVRAQRRADVREARALACCWAHGYDGDET